MSQGVKHWYIRTKKETLILPFIQDLENHGSPQLPFSVKCGDL